MTEKCYDKAYCFSGRAWCATCWVGAAADPAFRWDDGRPPSDE